MIREESRDKQTESAAFSFSLLSEKASLPTMLKSGNHTTIRNGKIISEICRPVAMGSLAYCFEDAKYYKLDGEDNVWKALGEVGA